MTTVDTRRSGRSATRSTGAVIEVLGGMSVRVDHTWLALRPSGRRVVAFLAVNGGMERADAAARLYLDMDGTRAAANLRNALWRLRHDAPGLVVEEGNALRLSAATVDLHDVRSWCEDVLRDDAELPHAPHNVSGDLLPGWGDDWLVGPREHTRMLQMLALEAMAQRSLGAGRLGDACFYAAAVSAMDPYRETAVRLVVEVHLREGNTVSAMRRYVRYRDLLAAEVGVEPGAALRLLVAPLIRPVPGAPRTGTG